MEQAALLVVGAGPYGMAVAARAIDSGIDTTVVGRAMGFWRESMPDGMFLRSGPDWHLDAAGVHTFEAFLEDSAISAADIDPVPIGVFLDYARWFEQQKKVVVDDRWVEGLQRQEGRFVASFDDGTDVLADRVVIAPGNGYFRQRPEWAATVPGDIASHTCDLVRFSSLAGARVLIVGGRQSAYEWAALLADHGAERVDIVHRHDVPRFDRVSWAFVDAYVDATVSTPGWWRSLPNTEQDRITRQFWEVGRLTLEWWLTPRLADNCVHRWPGTHVLEVSLGADGTAHVSLSNGERISVDRIVLATGYKTDLRRVPYLAELVDDIELADGFPVLDESFQTSMPGLYVPGFASTRDFGPFFGFTKGCPAAAAIVVDSLLS